jgi:hypothetical protein
MQSMMCVFFVKRGSAASSLDIQVDAGLDTSPVNLFRLIVDNGRLDKRAMTVDTNSSTPDVLPLGRHVHCDVDPGIYWFSTANPFRVATDGPCHSLLKRGKEPWPVPPAAPEGPLDLVQFYANHRGDYDREFGGVVSITGGGVQHWIVVATEEVNEIRVDLRGETPSLAEPRAGRGPAVSRGSDRGRRKAPKP